MQNYLDQLRRDFHNTNKTEDYIKLVQKCFDHIVFLYAKEALSKKRLDDYQNRNKVLQGKIEQLEKMLYKK